MPKFTAIPPRLNISRNVQVTRSANVNHARSESVVSVNPLNNDNLVAASKRFRNLRTYDFTIEAAVSFDGGKTWAPSPLPLHRDWGTDPGMSDPAIAWDNLGWVYLVVGPHWKSNDPSDAVGNPAIGIGTWVYISKNGGQSWDAPLKISDNRDDDKQWVTSDLSRGSPHYGNVYAAWGAGTPLHFATSRNRGVSWAGPNNTTPALSSLARSAFSPEVSVGPNGTVYICWHVPKSDSIQLVTSTDGGQSFTAPKTIVKGITGLHNNAPYNSKKTWPHFPGGTFRVFTLVTACVVDLSTLIVAWADYRDGVSRIYYRRSTDGGETWEGAASGQPLLGPTIASTAIAHEFHPQIVALPNGDVGCAFYEFGRTFSEYAILRDGRPPQHLMDVVLVASLDRGVTFSLRESVSDAKWNPRINAPWAHGDPEVTFIGEYFGLETDKDSFKVVWTDTRTGMQELFYAQAYIQTSITEFEPRLDNQIVFIPLHGSEGGVLFDRKTGKIFPIPFPVWEVEPQLRNRAPAVRDMGGRQIDRLLDAFATIEDAFDTGTERVKLAIIERIQLLAAQRAHDEGKTLENELPTEITTMEKRLAKKDNRGRRKIPAKKKKASSRK